MCLLLFWEESLNQKRNKRKNGGMNEKTQHEHVDNLGRIAQPVKKNFVFDKKLSGRKAQNFNFKTHCSQIELMIDKK